MSWQQDPTDATVTSNYGGSRGLEIIPSRRLEVGIFPPGYLVHQSTVPNGFGDLSFQVKFRAFSAPEGKGDYFVGLFLGGSFPTGTPPNGLGHSVWSPTLGLAKGIGAWDVQSTIGATLPASGTNLLGRTIAFNTGSREKSGLWSNKILPFGRAARWTARRKCSSRRDSCSAPFHFRSDSI